ncbi:MAG: sugar isomerase domain-containing protein [Erysipelotrichaceae bacterium]|nr:sugar isomerase domain-containing protein [Erysipelotrichaceae bacterium]
METWEKYLEAELSYLEKIRKTQREKIMEAAELCAECTMNDGIIRVFGVGHSHLVADDVFYRSATLGNVQAILEETATGNSEIFKSGFIEKLEGYAPYIVSYHKIAPPDVAIVISNSGNNPMAIDFADACRERGVKVIVLTNVEYSETLKPRHTTGRHLMDAGDIVVSNCSAIGDAAVEVEGMAMKVGSTSSIPFIYLINAILAQAVNICVSKGFKPDVYYNGSLRVNNPEIGKHNFAIVDKYYLRMKNL